MAFHKFIKGILRDEEIYIYGDGKQTRDFTYISDIVEANLLALQAPSGEVFNIGGGKRISLMNALSLIETLLKKKAKVKKVEPQKGDVNNTWADIEKAKTLLGYKPKVLLEEGLKEEISWIKEIYKG
jgi:nucleoside-diphosphate-sugar epimerase